MIPTRQVFHVNDSLKIVSLTTGVPVLLEARGLEQQRIPDNAPFLFFRILRSYYAGRLPPHHEIIATWPPAALAILNGEYSLLGTNCVLRVISVGWST